MVTTMGAPISKDQNFTMVTVRDDGDLEPTVRVVSKSSAQGKAEEARVSVIPMDNVDG
jgi:hypothetical protein